VLARTGFVTAGSARLHVRDVGESRSIVVLHGGPDFDYDYLLPELDRLAERFRLIYYDQRGRGRSADGVRPDDVTLESEMAGFRAGDLDVESEYYRIHFRPAFHAPELLERLMPRLRRNFTPERVRTARAIEDRLHEETWSSPGYDLLPKLRRLATPTLVLHGENDFVPVQVAAHVAEAIPGARLAVLPRCGHFAYLEAPDAVAQHVHELFATGSTDPRP
jgi:pimeloyl-ACP methyl ester carboxylesterase